MVTSIEGIVIFNVPGTSSHLPTTLTTDALAGKTTGKIARTPTDAAARTADPDVSV